MPEPAPPAAPTTTLLMFHRPGSRAWVRVARAATHTEVWVNGRRVGEHLGAWTAFSFEITDFLHAGPAPNELEIRCEDRAHFSNGFLPAIGVRWTGVAPRADDSTAPDVTISPHPPAATRPAAPRAEARGEVLLVDNRPLNVRGVLHWGYYPELGPPYPSAAQMRREIEELRAMGFNLLKFCLWIPPLEYYRLCEELDMFVWQEYPVWNTPLEADAVVLREFREMFEQDRGFGCIILRTLTCENDRVHPETGTALTALAHEVIPGALVLDNSGWLSSEHAGDFHDEHPYVHNALWCAYGERMKRCGLTRPLLLGETMVADTLNERHAAALEPDATARQALERRASDAALAVRRFQIETLGRDLPNAGYVICTLRDLPDTPLGLYTHEGQPKYTPEQWRWHGRGDAPRRIPPAAQQGDDHAWAAAGVGWIQPPRGRIAGPRKGAWKTADHTWWTPLVRVLDPALPAELIEAEAPFELLSGRVLMPHPEVRVLVEMCDVHSGTLRRWPLVIEFLSEGRPRIASALRHDTPAGLALWEAFAARLTDERIAAPPEIGPLAGDAILLHHWEMHRESTARSIRAAEAPFDPRAPWPAGEWTPVVCDTPLVNHFQTMFEGWATFRTEVDFPGGTWTLRCEAVADYFELFIDGERIGEAGPRRGTWDGTRDIPREFTIDGSAARRRVVIRSRDWRAAGGLTGPIYLTRDPTQPVF